MLCGIIIFHNRFFFRFFYDFRSFNYFRFFFYYNILAGVLRGLGDSFSALGFLLLTSVLNIILDLAFVDQMGVAGVALATVIAQFISAILCFLKLRSLKDIFTLKKSDLAVDSRYLNRIVRLGIPSGLNQALFSCAMMVVQRLINGFGSGYGFDGVAMALIGQLNPIATVFVAIFFAALRVGSSSLSF